MTLAVIIGLHVIRIIIFVNQNSGLDIMTFTTLKQLIVNKMTDI